jgi:hypothetical protein|tara:strand:+ start:783 stop:1097 length:315 start_codon:yes stop_codon:yes gene_type:complete
METMALRITHDTHYGINCAEAHCVIKKTKCDVEVDPNGVKSHVVHYSGKIFYNEQAYTDGKSPIGGFNQQYQLTVDDDASHYNIIKECYEHLKTLAGFDNGVDC